MLKRILLTLIASLAGAYVLPGVVIDPSYWGPALAFALVFSFLNASLGRAIRALGCLIQAITLGLFGIFINGLMILLAAKLVPGIHVASMGQAILLGLIISLSLGIFAKEEE